MFPVASFVQNKSFPFVRPAKAAAAAAMAEEEKEPILL
jgi:hypothetical protein